MIVTIYNTQKDLPLETKRLKKMVPLLLSSLKVSTDELILHFVSKKEIGKMHDLFFSDPSPTDCISFPLDPPDTKASEDSHRVLGEVFVCPKVALEYAEKRAKDPYLETALYIIHGILHLLGYDDLDPISRKKMRLMEKKCLKIWEPFSLDKKKIVLNPLTAV